MKNDEHFPGLIVADHQKTYANPFYNSLYDNASNVQYIYKNVSSDDTVFPKNSLQYFIAELAEIIGRSVYQLVTGQKYVGSDRIEKNMV